MPRPPLVLGTWGKITRSRRGSAWVAFARFRDFDGETRQIERTGLTGRQAEDALVEYLRDRTRLVGGEITADTRVDVLADRWYDTLIERNLAPQSLQTYRNALKNHVRPALGRLQVREVTVPVADRFVAAITKSHSRSTAGTCRVVLKGMFALAVRQGAAPTNPVLEAQTVRTERPEIRTIDESDVVLLRERVRAWDSGLDGAGRTRVGELADVVDMLLATGARTGEVLALRWVDVQLAADIPAVTIAGTVIQIRGEGLQRQNRTKSDRGYRRLKLPPFAVAMLLRRRADARSEWVFPSSTGTLRSPNNMRRQWRDFRDHHEYPDWITPKSFRKTVATMIANRGDIEQAADQLGHADSRVTKRHYADPLHEGPDLRAELERFGR